MSTSEDAEEAVGKAEDEWEQDAEEGAVGEAAAAS
jgi:hypothetical protein